MSDLVKRLREDAECCRESSELWQAFDCSEIMNKSADRIEQLDLEVDRLKAEAYDANRARDLAVEWRDYDKDRAERAEAEAELLKAEVIAAEQRGYARAMEAERILYDRSLKIVRNDALEEAAQAIESCAFDAEECYASEETVNAINGMASLCRSFKE